MKPVVKQMRGPGMNLGLKKPRKKMAAPEPIKPSRSSSKKGGEETTSYLPPMRPVGKPSRKRG